MKAVTVPRIPSTDSRGVKCRSLVRSRTESLGNTLGGSSSQGLGGVVGGLGQTLNDTLQGLAGKR
jgi:hypothetical protein